MNLGDRKTYIGGSDLASILGLSRWKTKLQLYLEKTGKIEEKDLSEVEAVEWGIALEDVVAKKFAKKNNIKVLRTNKNYIHPEHDYIRGHIDRLIAGTDEILEIKTCSAWKMKEWDGEDIPYEYVIQLQMYLGLTGRSIGHIACLIGGQKYIQKTIAFDAELYQMMIDKAVEFWNEHVIKDIPPLATLGDREALLQLYPKNTRDDIIVVNENINTAIALRQEISGQIGALEKQKEEVENQIKQVIADNIGIETSKYIIIWKPQSRKFVDTDKLKQDNIYEKYSKTNILRVLNVRLRKEDKK